ncbi:helix-turn-helix domain-containing protein [Cellulomonas sp. FA1]|uniref:helix-turn-helix domain-containing protein n=1 Tax=Cellulomonas sp. FA1 TaxID=1346710 RepID=UPI00069BB4AE|nr:helix-turn-helix transcriptional regulator [Cellulomonas sp. FA1]
MSTIGQDVADVDLTDLVAGTRARLLTTLHASASPRAWAAHDHEDHELIWGVRGVVTVRTGDEHRTVPPSAGLWIPAGVAHEVAATAGARFWTTHVARPVVPGLRGGARAVAVTPLLREVLLYLHNRLMPQDVREQAETLALALLDEAEVPPVLLPLPDDPRARRIARALVADPADDRTLAQWCGQVGSSVRHMSRVFRRETGMTFARWRVHARVRAATALLPQGLPVAAVARRVGYRSPSAFVHAFGEVTGCTPGAYLRAVTVRPVAVSPWADDDEAWPIADTERVIGDSGGR